MFVNRLADFKMAEIFLLPFPVNYKFLYIIILSSSLCISTLRICTLVGSQNLGRFQCVAFFIKNFYHIISLVILPLYLCCFLFYCVLKCVHKSDIYRVMRILEYDTNNQCFFMGIVQ